MTWQGSGGSGAPRDSDDDATRTDIPVTGQPAPPPFTPPVDDSPTAPVPEPASPFAPGGPGVDQPPAAPPDAPPAGMPPAPVQAPSPWAAPVATGGWGSVPTDAGRFAVPGAPGLVYAGAWPRLVAYIVDAVLLGVVAAIIALPFAPSVVPEAITASGAFDPANPLPAMTAAGGVSTVIALVIEAAYFSLLWASGGRATIGMRLLKLQVGDATTGNRIPLATAFRRWLGFGAWLNLLVFVPILGVFASLVVFTWEVILLITTASHPQKMGLHDRFANTAMVRPANAGSGGVIVGCIVIVVAILVLSLVALIFLGSQMSSILSAVGESV
jgi:uncharacterized RDD family membrane protein YckC